MLVNYFHHCWHDFPSSRGGYASTACTCVNHPFRAHRKFKTQRQSSKKREKHMCFGHVRNPAAICAQLLFFKHRWGALPALGGVMLGEVCALVLLDFPAKDKFYRLPLHHLSVWPGTMMSSWRCEIEFKTETCQIFHQPWSIRRGFVCCS